MSDSDGYPSWLPRRPPPPVPQSTIQSSILDPEDDPEFFAGIGGRKPTPRSVRIVNLSDATSPNVQFDAPPKVKVWSRASGPPPFSSAHAHLPLPLSQPRFNAKNLHVQLLRSPSRYMKAYFYIWPLLVFYHIPLQSFFDFNAVYILIQSVSPSSSLLLLTSLPESQGTPLQVNPGLSAQPPTSHAGSSGYSSYSSPTRSSTPSPDVGACVRLPFKPI
jgi:hypothetical protein